MAEKVKTLGILDKVKNTFFQTKSDVLVRSKGQVTQTTVREFFTNPDRDLYENIPECCIMSCYAYADTMSALVDTGESYTEIGDVPGHWIEVENVLDIVKNYRSTTGRKTYDGLAYRIFYNRDKNILILAFRGSTKRWGDWITNARWLTGSFPTHDDHYDVVHDQIDSLLDSALERLDLPASPSLRIIATGHSLGGGLATKAAYSSLRIQDAVVINSSPVTGYYQVPAGNRARNRKNLLITRIFEHGEILAWFRFPIRLLYKLSSRDPEIIEVRFNFGVRKSALMEHSLVEFTKEIWKHVRGVVINPPPK